MTKTTNLPRHKLSILLSAAQEIDRLSLVIVSAVRYADPTKGEAVATALLRLRVAMYSVVAACFHSDQ